mmetsp:Transcript_14198/g.49377  ORF Transcript_14198/g.49377 Transcript_14198/m.49377 type:complete len:317 (+) Transcript_14198:2922-3872(+)
MGGWLAGAIYAAPLSCKRGLRLSSLTVPAAPHPAPSNATVSPASVNLDAGVNLLDEQEGCKVARDARHEAEHDRDKEHVAQVQQHRHAAQRQARRHVQQAVHVDIHARGARDEEGAPPPVVVLRAQLEVGENDGDLGARDDEDDEGEAEEAEHVVVLRQPQRREDEVELHEDGAEGQDAADEHDEHLRQVPRLRRHVARHGADRHGELDLRALEADVRAHEHERHRDEQPQRKHGEHAAEGDRVGGARAPHEEVEQEDDREDEHGEANGRPQRAALPRRLAREHLVRARLRVARDGAAAQEEQHQRQHERAAVGRR